MNDYKIDIVDDVRNLIDTDFIDCNHLYREKIEVEKSILASQHISYDGYGDGLWKYKGCQIYMLRKSDGKIIGMCILSKNNDWLDTISIYHIGIAEKYRKRGLGEYLLNYVIDKHPNKSFNLMCLSENNQALGLYKKLGFNVECYKVLVRQNDK